MWVENVKNTYRYNEFKSKALLKFFFFLILFKLCLMIFILIKFSFDPNPTKRINFYGAIIGNALTYLGSLGYAQTGVQRYNSLPTLSQARRFVSPLH